MKILEFLCESPQSDEETAFAARVIELYQSDDDDYFDAQREFVSIYGYNPVSQKTTVADRNYRPDSSRSYSSKKPTMTGGYFYNVPDVEHQKAVAVGLHRTKSGKWMIPVYGDPQDKAVQHLKQQADAVYGAGKWWAPKK